MKKYSYVPDTIPYCDEIETDSIKPKRSMDGIKKVKMNYIIDLKKKDGITTFVKEVEDLKGEINGTGLFPIRDII